MLFSRNWLAQYVDLPDDVDDLGARLTAAGFNLEGVETEGGDVRFDLEITTNRSDCMNHLGLARELAVIYDGRLEDPTAGVVPALADGRPLDPDQCGLVARGNHHHRAFQPLFAKPLKRIR